MEQLDRRYLIGAGVAGAALIAKLAHAGPLNPPPGQVRSSGKTLDTVEPRIPVTAETCPGDDTAMFRIVSPGSYYLASSITGQAGKAIIQIECPGVTLDCRGFTLQGPPAGLAPCAAAIRSYFQTGDIPTQSDFADVFDCFVRGGCIAGIAIAARCSVADVDCDGCSEVGISVGPCSSVVNSRVCTCPIGYRCVDNAAIGEAVSCTFTDCLARACATGFQCGSGVCCDCCACVVCDSGFTCGTDCCIEDCACLECGSGITCGDRAVVCSCSHLRASSSSSTGVTGNGITVGADSDCDDCCVVASTGHGIECGTRSSVYCCRICRCPLGLMCADGCDVSECTFLDNMGGAVYCADSCCVFDCTSDIISAGAGGGPHIRCASHCRVEDNSIQGPAIGVQVQGAGTLVMSNSFHACTIPIEAAGNNSIAVQSSVVGQLSFGAGIPPLANLIH